MAAFAYYADNYSYVTHYDTDKFDITYGPGFAVTVAACCLAFINMFVPFSANILSTVREKVPPRLGFASVAV